MYDNLSWSWRTNKSVRLYNVQQVATEADLGFADAYIHGDFSFVDKDEGLVNIIMVK